MVKIYLAEAIGTFALVFAGTGAVIVNDLFGGAVSHVGVALTFGLVVMAMIYSLGDISGAHINPAVSLSLWLARRFEGRLVVPYMLSQFAGAVAASLVLKLLFSEHQTLGATLPGGPWWQSFVLETILTFFLVHVILHVTVGSAEKNGMAGAVIGGVVALEALFAGPVCGASMNPARSFAPAVVSGHVQHLWIYLLAPLCGGLLAVPFCRCIRGGNCCSGPRTAAPIEPEKNTA